MLRLLPWLFFVAGSATAMPFVPVLDAGRLEGEVPLGRYLEYRADDGHLTVATIAAGELILTPVGQDTWIPGPGQPVYWIRFRTMNHLDEPRRIWLEQRWMNNKDLRLFAIPPGGSVTDLTRGESALAKRQDYNMVTWSLEIPPGETTFLMRLESSTPGLEFVVYDDQAFHNYLRYSGLVIGLLFGGLIIMLCYNLFLFLTMHHAAHLFYVATLGSMFLEQLIFKGYIVIPWTSPVHAHMLSAQLACIFSVLLGNYYVDVQKYSPRLDRWNRRAALVMTAGLFISIFLPETLSVGVTLLDGAATIVFTSLSLATGIRYRNRSARFLLIAGIPAILIGLFEILFQVGLLPPNNHHEWNSFTGYLILTMLTSLGLGDRFNQQLRENSDRALQLQRRRMALEATGEATRAIQQSFLTRQKQVGGLSLDAWLRTAEKTGGDWYSVFRDPANGRLFALIGDVSGRGIPAALVTGAVSGAAQTAVESFGDTSPTLESSLLDLANSINRVVYRAGRGSMHPMSMALIAIDEATGAMLYLNAGHPPIYLLDQNRSQAILQPGTLLGHREDYIAGIPRKFQLHSGDRIIAYTDGLLENRGPDGGHLRIHQLRRLLNPELSGEQLVENIRNTTEKIWQDKALDDDCTCICLTPFFRDAPQG